MTSSFRKILVGLVIFVGSWLVAIIGYRLAGWSLLEAVYMVTITIYGVGYGEVRPLESPSLKIFTIGVIIAGCTSAIYVLGGFVQMIAEGELNRFLGARRMTKGIEKLSGHTIVCGYGRVGRILAAELVRAGEPFVVIDTNQERLQEAEQQGLFVILGDATEDAVLQSARIETAKTLATVLPDDAANVFITLTARELKSDLTIIARAQSPSTEKKLVRSGATRVVLPAAIGATQIARYITKPSVDLLLADPASSNVLNDDFAQLGLEVSEFTLSADSELAGKTVADLAAGNQFLLLAIRRADGNVTERPPSEAKLNSGDTLIVLASDTVTPKLRDTASGPAIVYRGARRG